jgi:hypothetical protein
MLRTRIRSSSRIILVELKPGLLSDVAPAPTARAPNLMLNIGGFSNCNNFLPFPFNFISINRNQKKKLP